MTTITSPSPTTWRACRRRRGHAPCARHRPGPDRGLLHSLSERAARRRPHARRERGDRGRGDGSCSATSSTSPPRATLCTTVEHRVRVRLDSPSAPDDRGAADRVGRPGPRRPAAADSSRWLPRHLARHGQAVGDRPHRTAGAVGRRASLLGRQRPRPRRLRGDAARTCVRSHRGFSTFEFQLGFGQRVQAGDPLLVRSALIHVGNSSLRILHVMTNERNGVEWPARAVRRAPRPGPAVARPPCRRRAPARRAPGRCSSGLRDRARPRADCCLRRARSKLPASLDLPRWRRR